MSKAHTEGPWTLHVGNAREAYVEAMDGDVLIAECHEGEAEANARLIAAAPEMLRALEMIVAELEVSAFYNADRIARQAIAKAEGRDQ